MATGGPARRVEGLVLVRGVLAVLIASSMSDNASAAVARGSGRTRFVLLMGRFSPKMGAIQVCANLTDLNGMMSFVVDTIYICTSIAVVD